MSSNKGGSHSRQNDLEDKFDSSRLSGDAEGAKRLIIITIIYIYTHIYTVYKYRHCC